MFQHAVEAIREAVTFPLVEDGRRIRRLLFGSVLIATTPLLVPLVFLGGYYVRYLRASAHDDPDPPRFDEWGALFTDGLKLFGLGIAFAVVVLAFALGGTVAGQIGVLAVEALGAVGGLVAAALALIVLGAFVLFLATVPAMVSNFAVEGRLGAAFDLGRASVVVTTPVYLLLLFVAFFVNQVGLVFGGMLAVLLVGFPIAFYAQLVAVGLVGRGFAYGIGITTPDTAGGPTGVDSGSVGADGESTEPASTDTVEPEGASSSASGPSDTPAVSDEEQSSDGGDNPR